MAQTLGVLKVVHGECKPNTGVIAIDWLAI